MHSTKQACGILPPPCSIHLSIHMSSDSPQRPQDGPATSFTADPFVTAIYNGESDFFDLGLVAGFPLFSSPSSSTTTEPQDEVASYHDFIKLVQSCFDHDTDDLMGDRPAAFFYPSFSLHVTIATLAPLHRKHLQIPTSANGNASDHYSSIQQYFQNLVRRASQRSTWPTRPLQLQIDSAQLGTKAGILLWKDLSGGVAQMRTALREEEQQEHDDPIEQQLQQLSPYYQIHSIPNIIHTSFLRFSKEPQTCGSRLQERFQKSVVPRLPILFPSPITVSSIYLVCECTPYMQIEKNAETVLMALPLL